MSIALAAMIGVTATLLTPAAAQAAYFGSETDYAQPSGGPTGSYSCNTWHPHVTVCFRPEGDDIWVLDKLADGHSAVGEWRLRTTSTVYRTGSCVSQLGKGYWGYCNKDFTGNLQFVYNGARYEGGNLVDRNLSELAYS
jgi:hypothetical protein